MSWPFGGDLHFGTDVFIPINHAFAYLDDPKVVFQLERLFFYYKGFALEQSTLEDRDPMRVYLDAVEEIKGINLRRVWQIYKGNIGSFYTDIFNFRFGKIDNKVEEYIYGEWVLGCVTFELDSFIEVNLRNIYVKQSDLDDVSEKYGISKRTFWDDQSFKIPALNNSSVNENTIIGSIDSPQNLFVDFIKSILAQHPNATTADIRRNCFENMDNLNSRDCKTINDLLIKAGAIKSKQGGHAKDIEWESKYPKAQWMRVFNKRK